MDQTNRPRTPTPSPTRHPPSHAAHPHAQPRMPHAPVPSPARAPALSRSLVLASSARPTQQKGSGQCCCCRGNPIQSTGATCPVPPAPSRIYIPPYAPSHRLLPTCTYVLCFPFVVVLCFLHLSHEADVQ
jgi:hypothetical protein